MRDFGTTDMTNGTMYCKVGNEFKKVTEVINISYVTNSPLINAFRQVTKEIVKDKIRELEEITFSAKRAAIMAGIENEKPFITATPKMIGIIENMIKEGRINDLTEVYQLKNKKELNKMQKQFTKSDLKTGMWVKYKDGTNGMVLLGTKHGDIITGVCWISLSAYKENLEVQDKSNDESCGIAEIWEPNSQARYINKMCLYNSTESTLVYKCEDKKELTLEQVIKAAEENLGYKIKIVGEK